MAASAEQRTAPGRPASLAVAIYLILLILSIFLTVLAVTRLPLDIVGGIYIIFLAQRWWVTLLIAVLLVATVLAWPQISRFIPPILRTLILPLPFYLIITGDLRTTLFMAGFSVVALLIHRYFSNAIATLFSGRAAAIGSAVARALPLTIYIAAITRQIVPTIAASLFIFLYFYFEGWLGSYFEPVWRFERSLPEGVGRVVKGARIVLGVLAMLSLPWLLGWGSTGLPALIVPLVITSLVGLILLRGPASERRLPEAA